MGPFREVLHTGPQMPTAETGISNDCFLSSENGITLPLKTEVSESHPWFLFLRPCTHPILPLKYISSLSNSLHPWCLFSRSSYCQHSPKLLSGFLSGLPTSPLGLWHTASNPPNSFSSVRSWEYGNLLRNYICWTLLQLGCPCDHLFASEVWVENMHKHFVAFVEKEIVCQDSLSSSLSMG